jgi:hypothetical protein
VSVIEPSDESQWLETLEGPRNDGCRRLKGDDVRNRTRGRSAAERAIRKMSVRCRFVVPMMRKVLPLVGRGAHFQQERRTGRRHEAHWNIGAKQQRRQQ